MCEVHAEKAIKHLGIKDPVEFVEEDLNHHHGDPVSLALGLSVSNAAAYPVRVNGVYCIAVDWFAVHWTGVSPAKALAHELVHIAQFEHLRQRGFDDAFVQQIVIASNVLLPYDQNPFEELAAKQTQEVADLIRVKHCKEFLAPTARDMGVGYGDPLAKYAGH